MIVEKAVEEGMGIKEVVVYVNLDERKPENAEDILKKELKERSEELRNAVIGFADESSVECDPKKRRVLGCRKIKAETTSKRKTIFGFMSFNGKDVAMISNTSKAKDFVEFIV